MPFDFRLFREMFRLALREPMSPTRKRVVWLALLFLPLMIFVSFRFRLKARLAYRATRNSLGRLNSFLQERLTGLDVVHLFDADRGTRLV